MRATEDAIAVGTSEDRIAKTLSFKIEDKTILVVCAGDTRIYNVKYKNEFKAKAKMLNLEEVEKYSNFIKWVDVCKIREN